MAARRGRAKAEGKLTTIALPHDWCNYGEVIDTFKTKYGLDGQRARPAGRLRRRDRGDQGQQGQPRPAGARTSSTSAWRSARSSRPRASRAVQGRDLGHDPRRGQGRRRRLVRRLLRRPLVRGQHRRRRQRPPGLGRPAQARVQGPGRPRRRPAHLEPGDPGGPRGGSRQRRLARRRHRRVSTSSSSSTTPATSCRSSRRPRRSPPATRPIAIRWTYNALANRDSHGRQRWSGDRSRRPEVRPVRRRLRPGDQRLRAASERRQALEGVPLLRRGPEPLAEGLLPPDPVRGSRRERNAVPAEQLAKLPDVTGAVFPTLEQLDKAKTLITGQWDAVVGANVQ